MNDKRRIARKQLGLLDLESPMLRVLRSRVEQPGET